MPVRFKVYSEQGFTMANFYGQVTLAQFVSSAEDYARDPAYRIEQNLLIDLTDYDGTEGDFVGLMRSIAQVSGILTAGHSDRLVVYMAPTENSQFIANFIAKSLAAVPGFVVRITDNYQHAFEILGVAYKDKDKHWVEGQA